MIGAFVTSFVFAVLMIALLAGYFWFLGRSLRSEETQTAIEHEWTDGMKTRAEGRVA